MTELRGPISGPAVVLAVIWAPVASSDEPLSQRRAKRMPLPVDDPMHAAAGALDRRRERRGLLPLLTVGRDASPPGPGLRLTLAAPGSGVVALRLEFRSGTTSFPGFPCGW